MQDFLQQENAILALAGFSAIRGLATGFFRQSI
jgi:hypothetical protein